MSNNNLTVTGIDFGSSAVKIAAVLKGGVQIITNEANFRQTPNVIGFGDKERLIGQAGQVKAKSNHSNTVNSPNRFLGFNRTCPYLSEQLKFCPAKGKIQGENSYLKFNVLCGSQRDQFIPEQLVASYITEIEKIISQTNNLQNKNMVIAVPSYFTQSQRKALLDAVQISKKKSPGYSTQLVNQEIAVSMDYGFSKKNEFSENLENNKNVLFIDFGHSKMNTFVTAFNKQHMRILANKFNRQLGCKFMDEELLKFYAKIFDEAHPNLQLNLLESKKAVLKLLQSIEKQRKVLSGNFQHDLSIECLLEEEDIHYSMKRDQYSQICQPIIMKFKETLSTFSNELNSKGIKFESIELIGGGTRIPAIINAITQVFGTQPSRTINSSECIARGAALVSAMSSTIFRVQPYNYFSLNPFDVEVKINNQTLAKRMVQKNEILIKQKQYQFEIGQQLRSFKLSLQYSVNQIQNGLESKILQCQVQVKEKNPSQSIIQESSIQVQSAAQETKQVKLSISILFDQNGLVLLDKVSSLDNNYSVKAFKVNTFSRFSTSQLNQMQQKQKQMAVNDLKIKIYYEKKNEYESWIYKSKDLTEQFVKAHTEYISQAKINQIKAIFQDEESWVHSNIQHTNDIKLQDFTQRAAMINKQIDQFKLAINQLKHSHLLVNQQLQKLANFLNEMIQKRSEGMYPDEVNKAGQWINQIFEKQKLSAKFQLPIVTSEEIKKVYESVVQKVKQFDIQTENQRREAQKKAKYSYQQPRSQFHPKQQSTFNPFGGSMGRQQEDYYRPRTNTRNNRGGYQSSNPFGSFLGGNRFF